MFKFKNSNSLGLSSRVVVCKTWFCMFFQVLVRERHPALQLQQGAAERDPESHSGPRRLRERRLHRLRPAKRLPGVRPLPQRPHALQVCGLFIRGWDGMLFLFFFFWGRLAFGLTF